VPGVKRNNYLAPIRARCFKYANCYRYNNFQFR